MLSGSNSLRSKYNPARIYSSDFGCIGGRAGEYTSDLSVLGGQKAAKEAAVDSRELIGGNSPEAEDAEVGDASIPAAEAGTTGARPKVNGLIRSMAPLVMSDS